MIDALGAPQSLLVLGATSDIAAATVTRLAAAGRLETVVLCARSAEHLSTEADRVRALGVPDVRTAPLEASDRASVAAAVSTAFSHGDVDVVLVAFGVLIDQQQALADPNIALAGAQVNYLGAAAACLHSATALRAQGHGVLVVLSSVAAERPRASNFIYGSGKAGLDALCTGLGDQLRDSGAAVLVIRPGFVHSKMTRGLPAPPLSTTPDVVAAAIADHLTAGSRTVWVPATLRAVMSVLRHLPRAVFRQLPL